MRSTDMSDFGAGCLVGFTLTVFLAMLPILCHCKEKVDKLNHIIEIVERHADMESLTADELLRLGRNGYKPNTGENNDDG